MSLKIGDTTGGGQYQLIGTEWDHNGTLRVKTCIIGRILHTERDIRAMRRLARRAIAHPEKTQSSRLVRVWHNGDSLYAEFAVSRLPQ